MCPYGTETPSRTADYDDQMSVLTDIVDAIYNSGYNTNYEVFLFFLAESLFNKLFFFYLNSLAPSPRLSTRPRKHADKNNTATNFFKKTVVAASAFQLFAFEICIYKNIFFL